MILEGLVTTLGPSGAVNLAPMGPRLFPPFILETGTEFELRPFATSQTWANLQSHPEGVLHVTDDLLLLARAAINSPDLTADFLPAQVVAGSVIAGACRAYEFRIHLVDDSTERIRLSASVVHVHRLRDFFGLNRAMHAVVEAAILATRVHLLPTSQIAEEFRRLAVLIEKTGGPREHQAFDVLKQFVKRAANEDSA